VSIGNGLKSYTHVKRERERGGRLAEKEKRVEKEMKKRSDNDERRLGTRKQVP